MPICIPYSPRRSVPMSTRSSPGPSPNRSGASTDGSRRHPGAAAVAGAAVGTGGPRADDGRPALGAPALMARARAESDLVVTSIFVNPLQFGADEDFVQYPRPIASDLAKCEEAGVDFVFAPALGEMYPSAPEVRVVAGRMGAVFEGEARPGHFDGVLTVVAKLFNLIKPD